MDFRAGPEVGQKVSDLPSAPKPGRVKDPALLRSTSTRRRFSLCPFPERHRQRAQRRRHPRAHRRQRDAPSLTFKADRANRPGQNDPTSHHQHPLDRDSTTEHFPAMNYRDIITIEAGKRSGKPCIRGMRITVTDVLEYLASGMSIPAILTDFPELTEDDIRACLAFAADRERRLAVIGG
jgi:uncharacterized protein (DUF433 family)